MDDGTERASGAVRARATRLKRRGLRAVRALRRAPAPAASSLDAGFRSELENEELPLSIDVNSDSRTLLIALGGIARGVSMPPFEFFKATDEIACKRLFVRDVKQAWYQMGLPGYGDDFVSVADALRELIAGYDVDRLVLAGASAGGYAALAFGTLLGADRVLCFAPQSTIDLEQMHAIGDHRYDERLGEVTAAGAIDSNWIDLRTALPAARVADTRYQIYFADAVSTDRLHAERLLGLAGVRLYRFGRGNHNIARALRQSGALETVLQRALIAPQRLAAG
jgi:hypothetical protein